MANTGIREIGPYNPVIERRLKRQGKREGHHHCSVLRGLGKLFQKLAEHDSPGCGCSAANRPIRGSSCAMIRDCSLADAAQARAVGEEDCRAAAADNRLCKSGVCPNAAPLRRLVKLKSMTPL
ncbi:hypothetical protein [Sphingomonas sp.]|uniref:hypothetical protein n=1 Tax=Sphingomonas sp. TaxID=28214 RepID=UPI0025ECC959|nr:hypothetical protein [Sphingomonas sp.]